MPPPSTQQSFRLQVKRIWKDSSFVTLMSFSLFRIPRQNSRLPLFLQPFTYVYCEAVRHVISVESCQVESWPSNHVWNSGCIYSNEIDWTATFTLSSLSTYAANTYGKRWKNSGLGELRFRWAYVTSKTLTFSYSSFLVLTQFTWNFEIELTIPQNRVFFRFWQFWREIDVTKFPPNFVVTRNSTFLQLLRSGYIRMMGSSPV